MSDEQPQFHHILSAIGGSNWVLTATRDGTGVHLSRHGKDPLDDDLQLWRLVPDNRIPNGCYMLNPFLDKVIKRTNVGANTWMKVELVPATAAAEDPDVLWQRPPDNQFAGICYQNLRGIPMPWSTIWNGCLNVAGDGPYDESSGIITYKPESGENSSWQCVPDTTKLTPTGIDYDLSKAVVDLNVPPTDCQSVLVDNLRSSVAISQTLRLVREKSSTKTASCSKTDEHGLQIANTFGVKLKFGKIAEVSNSTSVTVSDSSSVTIGSEEAQTTSETDEVSESITVPPHMKIRCFVRVNRGSVRVPYVAHIERRLPGAGKPRTYDIHGEFTNVNAMSYTVVAEDVQSQQEVQVMGSVPLDVGAGSSGTSSRA